jgi:DNA-binding SARP family transcriptional activator/tetratricopeptide (TPR) repeat protein
MAQLRITVLGGVSVQLPSGETVAVPGQKAQALLGYLALRPGQAQTRDKLAALLWPDAPHERARQSLRQTLLVLRHALPAASFSEKGETVSLDASTLEVDAREFERLVAAGSPELLERAAALYHGDLLAGLGGQAATFEEWLLSERERLRELALEALTKLLAHQSKSGATEHSIQTAVRLLALDPLQEAVHRALMRVFARQGRRAAALKQYQVCVGVLHRVLGTEPEAQTKQLYRDILRHELPEPAGVEAPPGRPMRRPRPESVRLQPELPAHDTRLIGRDSELARVRQALDQTWKGRGQVVIIVGEAGIGKTRLIEDLAADAVERGGRAVLGRSYESMQILPFGPWVNALRSGQVFLDTELVDMLAPAWRAELARLFPEVEHAGLPAPSDDYLRLFESVARLVEQLASTQPVVLLLEDLHWADEMSLRLFSFLARRTQASPVALIATAREEELADASGLRRTLQELHREAHVAQVRLPPLSRADTMSLVRALSRAGGDAVAVTRLEEQVWNTSEGNPFLVVETLRAFQEGGAAQGAATLPLPERVREVIAGRLERLSDRSQGLVATAAVIGCAFEFAVLQRAAELTEREAAEGVEELVRRHVLRGVGEDFDFAHDQIRNVAYTQLLPPRRKLLHARVASALEERYKDDLERHRTALGRHCWEAELWDRAVTHLRQAGAQAAARSAHREAVAYFERALEALAHLPETREVLEQTVDFRFDLRTSRWPLADIRGIAEDLRRAERLAVALRDQRRLGWVSVYRAHYAHMTVHARACREAAESARRIAESLEDFELQASAKFYLGWSCLRLGEYREAEQLLRAVIQLLEGSRSRERCRLTGFPAVMARWLLAWSLTDRGEFDEALLHGEEAIRLAEALDHPYSLILAWWSLAYIHSAKGDLSEAMRLYERALAIARDWNIAFLAPYVMLLLGSVYTRSGRVHEGLALLENGLGTMEAMGLVVFHSFFRVLHGEACLIAGRLDEAVASAERAITLSGECGERGDEAWALRMRGDIASHRDGPNAAVAEASYRQALGLAAELGMRPLVAHCHLGLGELYRKARKREQARAELATAIELYRSMTMASWRQRAETARAALA